MRRAIRIAEVLAYVAIAGYVAYGLLTGNANSITYHL